MIQTNYITSYLTIISLLAISIISSSCSQENIISYRDSDKIFVNKAFHAYSGNGKITLDEVKDEVDPVVVHFQNATCVGLNLKRGWAGGDSTICFDNKSQNIIVYYVNGK